MPKRSYLLALSAGLWLGLPGCGSSKNNDANNAAGASSQAGGGAAAGGASQSLTSPTGGIGAVAGSSSSASTGVGGAQNAGGSAATTSTLPSATGGAASGGGTTSGAGGAKATGGSATGNGGATTVGTTATGGKSSTGGTLAAGGVLTTGGAMATGGTTAGGQGTIPAGLLDSNITTTWNPGILVDTQLNQPLGADGLPVRTTVCATVQPGGNIASAISSCPEGQVVQLVAGTYTVSSTITLNKGVVLRGAGSKGASAGGTTIVKTGGGSVLAIGTNQDQTCYNGAFGTAYALTQSATKETNVVTIGSSASNFAKGNLAIIDQLDDATVQEGDCDVFKRVDKRSVSERVEVASVDATAGTITLTTPLHWTFKAGSPYTAQIAKVSQTPTRWAGIEGVYLQGGSNPGYDGQMAGGIDISNAAYCWVKDVQTDGTIGGIHVALTGTYRCVVRDSYVHHSANYGFAQDCYGIVVRCGSADNLIENNIARYMNKPIQLSVSGGGNVLGYNYADNAWADPPAFQEDTFDTHCSFPHMELMEGNYVPHMKASITHGNSGYLTYFRNYSSSQFASPPVVGSTAKQTGNVLAIGFDEGDINMTVVGNVLGSSAANDLGTATLSDTYQCFDGSDGACILYFGGSNTDVSYTTLWLHGNYDTVNAKVMWNPAITTQTLPASLYLPAKPGWWPSTSAWPWVGPDLSPMVGTLPAKARAETY